MKLRCLLPLNQLKDSLLLREATQKLAPYDRQPSEGQMKSTNQNEVKDGEECKPVQPVSPCLQPSYASVLSRHEDSYPINNRVIKKFTRKC